MYRDGVPGVTQETVKHATGWHLDRRVPIALIVALMIQTSAGIWWAATLTARVSTIELWVADNRQVKDRLTRMETRQEYMIQTIEKIDRKLEE